MLENYMNVIKFFNNSETNNDGLMIVGNNNENQI